MRKKTCRPHANFHQMFHWLWFGEKLPTSGKLFCYDNRIVIPPWVICSLLPLWLIIRNWIDGFRSVEFKLKWQLIWFYVLENSISSVEKILVFQSLWCSTEGVLFEKSQNEMVVFNKCSTERVHTAHLTPCWNSQNARKRL